MKRMFWFAVLVAIFCTIAFAGQQAEPQGKPETPAATKAADAKPTEDLAIPKGAKVFIAPMPDNFNDFIKKAIQNKHVPVTVVDNKQQADFEITGFSETQKAGTAK